MGIGCATIDTCATCGSRTPTRSWLLPTTPSARRAPLEAQCSVVADVSTGSTVSGVFWLSLRPCPDRKVPTPRKVVDSRYMGLFIQSTPDSSDMTLDCYKSNAQVHGMSYFVCLLVQTIVYRTLT